MACRAAPDSRKGRSGEVGATVVHPATAEGALERVFRFTIVAVADRAGVGGTRARVGALAAQKKEKLEEQQEEAKKRRRRVADGRKEVHTSQR